MPMRYGLFSTNSSWQNSCAFCRFPSPLVANTSPHGVMMPRASRYIDTMISLYYAKSGAPRRHADCDGDAGTRFCGQPPTRNGRGRQLRQLPERYMNISIHYSISHGSRISTCRFARVAYRYEERRCAWGLYFSAHGYARSPRQGPRFLQARRQASGQQPLRRASRRER